MLTFFKFDIIESVYTVASLVIMSLMIWCYNADGVTQIKLMIIHYLWLYSPMILPLFYLYFLTPDNYFQLSENNYINQSILNLPNFLGSEGDEQLEVLSTFFVAKIVFCPAMPQNFITNVTIHSCNIQDQGN